MACTYEFFYLVPIRHWTYPGVRLKWIFWESLRIRMLISVNTTMLSIIILRVEWEYAKWLHYKNLHSKRYRVPSIIPAQQWFNNCNRQCINSDTTISLVRFRSASRKCVRRLINGRLIFHCCYSTSNLIETFLYHTLQRAILDKCPNEKTSKTNTSLRHNNNCYIVKWYRCRKHALQCKRIGVNDSSEPHAIFNIINVRPTTGVHIHV